MQAAIGAMEQAASVIGGYQPNIMHGLAQTADYAREMLHLPGGPADHGASEDEINRMIAARLRRQAILYEPGRTITVLVGEAALRNRVAGAGTMRDQLEHLARLATATSATIGVVPFVAHAAVMCMHGWDQRDDIVTVETTAGDLEIADPEEVARYQRYMDLLADSAHTGEDAASFCRRLAADLYAA